MPTQFYPRPLELLCLALLNLGAVLSPIEAHASDRIDVIESPRLKFGEATVGLKAYGYDNTRSVCQALGYAQAVDSRMWTYQPAPTSVDFVLYPNSGDYTQIQSEPAANHSVWQRILCKGPGTYPRLDQAIPVTTIHAPGTQVGPLFVRFHAYGYDNAGAICKKIGFKGAFSAVASWTHTATINLPEKYLKDVGYFHQVNRDLSLTAVATGGSVWEKIHCIGRASPTFAGSIDLANLGATLSTIADQMYPQRKAFLEGARKTIDDAQARGGYDRVQAQVFAALALDPFMTQLDSEWYQTKVAPAWNRDIPGLAREADVQGLRDIFPTPNVARAALGLLHEGFAAMQSSLSTIPEQTAGVEIQTNIGFASASTFKPKDPKMAALISTLDRHSSVLTNLKLNTRTAAIAHSMSAIVEYLRVYYVN